MIQFHLRNPMVWFVFVYDVCKWPKNMIYFYDVTTFHTYYSHLGVKDWDRNLKFDMLTTLVCVLYLHIIGFFLKIWNILDFRAIFPEKHVFLKLWGQNPKFWKSEIAIL